MGIEFMPPAAPKKQDPQMNLDRVLPTPQKEESVESSVGLTLKFFTVIYGAFDFKALSYCLL
jgi:hypothetical protein